MNEIKLIYMNETFSLKVKKYFLGIALRHIHCIEVEAELLKNYFLGIALRHIHCIEVEAELLTWS